MGSSVLWERWCALVRPNSVLRWIASGLATVVAVSVMSVMLVMPAMPASAKDLDAIAIGDSVMLGAKSQLQKAGIDTVDAKVSRQASSGVELLRKRGSALPEHVVIHLGTNGSHSVKACKQMVRAAGKDRTVYLVNFKVPRSWEKPNNRILRKCDRKFRSDRVVLLDWNAAASKNPEYLYADGYHLRPEGAKAFATMVRRAITAPRAPYSDRLELGSARSASTPVGTIHAGRS